MIAVGAYAPLVTQHVAGTPTTDAYGNEIPVYTDATVQALASYPANSAEDTAGVDEVTSDWELLFNPETTVSPLDEFTVNGTRFAVDGEPASYQSPLTGTAITQVPLRRIT